MKIQNCNNSTLSNKNGHLFIIPDDVGTVDAIVLCNIVTSVVVAAQI